MPTAATSKPMKPLTDTPELSPSPTGDATCVLAFPASVAQQMFWYLELLQGEVTAFNVPLRFRLAGPLDVRLLERSLNAVIERHEALRTRFGEQNGELLQIVSPELVLKIPVIDLSHLPPVRIDEEAERLGSIEARRPFHLSTGPMIRAELVRLGPESHIFHVSIHHALFDGMSMTVLTRELADIYQAYFDGKPCPLEPLPIQYGDFSVWQKEFLEGPEMKKQLGYWKQQLEGMTELDLPTDFPRPPVKSWKGDITSTLLPKELTDKLHALAARNGATLFHLQLAAFMILLHRYTGAPDIALGTPVTGRTRGELEPLVGVFINSLILRCDLSGNPGFEGFLSQVRETALEALENQELPFECLVRELRPERDPSRNPLFQVNFNHHRSFARAGTFGGVTLTPIPSRSPGTIFDLHFFMVERKEGWRASCDYSTDLFTRTSADRMLGHYKRLLEDIAEHPERTVEDLAILPGSEERQLLEWSAHPVAHAQETTIGSLFLEIATASPHRIALDGASGTFTYRQLHAEASRVARELLDSGVQPGELVAIAARTSPESIIGLLGIVLAGGGYVPLDPDYPELHRTTLLEESGVRFSLAAPGCGSALENWPGTIVEIPKAGTPGTPLELPLPTCRPDDPAYLVFTSGSTGKPKGVLAPHCGVIRLVRDCDYMTVNDGETFLQTAPLSFDASTLEIWAPLLNGGRLVLPPHKATLEQIAAAIREHGVTTLWLTSGLFQLMIDEQIDSLKGLRQILTGGEVISTPHVRRALEHLPETRLIHAYGPTENTTFTTCHTLTAADLAKPSIPIGRPIAGTSVLILDELGRPVPAGIPGILHTGGGGLAIGYHNDPALTEKKFIRHPRFGRLYHSGDSCRWTADGTVEFIGRKDEQVKLRGFRIELGEIEVVLSAHPQVRQVKAAVRGDRAETKRILAWVVPAAGESPSQDELTAWLAEKLPSFMQPDGIAVMDSFPLNANGKIDLASLPDPEHRPGAGANVPHEEPDGRTECHLAAIWQELLGISGIGRHDDFFALGGHSLMALRMFSRINREFYKSLPLAALIQHPTIATLATLLDPPAAAQPVAVQPVAQSLSNSGIQGRGHVVTLAEGGKQLPLFCIHGGDGGVLFYRGLATLMPPELPFHAIESLELGNSGRVDETMIEATAAAYIRNILRIQPAGPFRLAGYSFGGVVAHEMACQLVEQGYQVEFLGLFDTHNPAAPARAYSLPERLGVFWHQSADFPLHTRLGLLRKRIGEGIRTNRGVRAELKAARASGPAPAYSDLRRIQVREENWRAMGAYQPRPFKGRITLFKTSFVNDKVERPADYGWSGLALSGLDIVSVSGHHLDLFAPEHIGVLAQALTHSLKRSAHPPT